MSFYRFFYPLWLNANIALSDACRAVLQETLDKGNVIAIVSIDLSRIPLPEAVCANAFKAKIIADKSKLFLYGSGGQREQYIIALNAITQAVVFNILINHNTNLIYTFLKCA